MKKASNKITELQKQVEELKTKYLRALADYQNLERRTHVEVSEVRKYAAEVILARLLPVVDTLSKAKEHLKDPGLDLVYKELQAVLAEQGVERIEAVGKYFNPHEMECVEVIEGKDNEVAEEVLPGYRLHGKILRVVQVKVGKKQINKQAEELAQKELQKGDYM